MFRRDTTAALFKQQSQSLFITVKLSKLRNCGLTWPFGLFTTVHNSDSRTSFRATELTLSSRLRTVAVNFRHCISSPTTVIFFKNRFLLQFLPFLNGQNSQTTHVGRRLGFVVRHFLWDPLASDVGAISLATSRWIEPIVVKAPA